ncbi:MAG: sulfite oxidase-like oxidoreductase [Planctomycetaceae bacterium]
MQEDPKYQPGEPPVPVGLSADVVISPDTLRADRIPPGQVRTRKWPVLHATTVPQIDLAEWTLTITGLVEHPLRWSWDEFRAFPRVQVFADFHCVTRWSRLGNLWEGVLVSDLLRHAGIDPRAKFAIVGGADAGWTTNLPIEYLLSPDTLLADTHDGSPLDADHGGPVRLIVPRLYAWKSAKWVTNLHLVESDSPGYWEQLGYHSHGDPWTEERYE